MSKNLTTTLPLVSLPIHRPLLWPQYRIEKVTLLTLIQRCHDYSYVVISPFITTTSSLFPLTDPLSQTSDHKFTSSTDIYPRQSSRCHVLSSLLSRLPPSLTEEKVTPSPSRRWSSFVPAPLQVTIELLSLLPYFTWFISSPSYLPTPFSKLTVRLDSLVNFNRQHLKYTLDKSYLQNKNNKVKLKLCPRMRQSVRTHGTTYRVT